MRIGIVGAGALGCLFGGLLVRAGNDVTLVHRTGPVVNAIRKRGVIVRSKSGRSFKVHLSVRKAPGSLPDADLVIFAVKSYSTREAALMHKNRLGKEVPILTLQNGLGNVEILSQVFGKTRILAGTTTEASLLLGPGEVSHTGRGETRIGEVSKSSSGRCDVFVDVLNKAGIKTEAVSNVRGAIWAKAILNSVINPISAVLKVPNGVLASEALLPSIREVVDECVAVSRAEHVRLDPPDPYASLIRVVAATASNRSSMLQDLDRGKTTEVRQLNGAIVRLGEKHRVHVPLNRLLFSLVVAAEKAKLRSWLLHSAAR